MSTTSKIEWTDKTWNPVRGCSLVSAGCANCYAMKQAHRFSGAGQPYEGLTELGPHGPRWTGKIALVPDALDEPLRWKEPRKIFVNSMSDLFHEDVPDEFIAAVFGVMAACPMHTFQILTKRPERMRQWFRWVESKRSGLTVALVKQGGAWPKVDEYSAESVLCAYCAREVLEPLSRITWAPWPLPNVWLGVSIEDQKTADERIPILLQTPAAVRFVSYEPALGPVSFRWAKWDSWKDGRGERRLVVDQHDGLRMLDWVIVGGESKDGARPMHPDWARSVRDQCQAAGVPFFFKQWGEWKPISQMANGESDALHRSCRTAKPYENQESIDELYGRRCTVATQVIRYDGATFDSVESGAWEARAGYPSMLCFNVGKKRAGALLDGQEWREFPR